MRKEIPDENGLPGCGSIGEILGYAVVERELTFLHQHHDGRGNKLLAHRSGLEEGLRLDRHAQLHIGLAVALGQKNLPSAVDAQSKSRDLLPRHLSSDERVDGAETLWVQRDGSRILRGRSRQAGQRNRSEQEDSDQAHGNLRRVGVRKENEYAVEKSGAAHGLLECAPDDLTSCSCCVAEFRR